MFTLRTLRWLSIAAPLAFIVGLGFALEGLLKPALPDGLAYIIAAALAAQAITVFSGVIFNMFQQMQGRLRRQAEELKALYEAGMTLTSELSLEAVLQKLVELGRRLTGARYGALSVLEPDGTIDRFLTSGINGEERRRIGELPQGKGLLGVILREGASLRLDDMGQDLRHVGFPAHHPPMKSLLGLPVVSRGRVIGNLYLTEKEGGRPFDDRDEELVRLLAAQAAVAIENARLYEAERRRAEEWKTLFELGQEVTASPNLQSVLNSVVERARALLKTEVAVLMLLGPGGEGLKVTVQVGLNTAAMQQLSLLTDQGLQGLVIETGGPVIVRDYQSDPRLRQRPAELVQPEGLVSLISVPFSAKGRLLGTLTVGNRQATKFTERQAELLAVFATWAAVAVETSELYERLKSLALLEERERIGMDLHDGVIQSIYAVGLSLEDAAERLEESPQGVRQRLDKAIDDLNQVIRDIRSYIFDLRPQVPEAKDLKRALAELIEEVKVNTLMATDLHIDSPLPPLNAEQARGLFHIAQEALHNVAKHAHASSVQVHLAANGRVLTLEVADNGVGFDSEAQRHKAKQGLRNMMDRARSLGASLQVQSAEGKGTVVRVSMPFPGQGTVS